jgi:2-dehydro-3-deoxyphosphogalactonate aldolase
VLRGALSQRGLIAILRGVQPHEVVEIGQGLYSIGFRIIEVPLNSPEPIQSIGNLRTALPADCQVGAGTVYLPAQVESVRAAGGSLIVMPHCAAAVIDAARTAKLDVLPGVATPTEAFAAFAAGITLLKFFPADHLGPTTMKAWLSVLPREMGLIPVGGICPENVSSFVSAGAIGFGIGSALYKPGMTAAEVTQRGQHFMAAWIAAESRNESDGSHSPKTKKGI